MGYIQLCLQSAFMQDALRKRGSWATRKLTSGISGRESPDITLYVQETLKVVNQRVIIYSSSGLFSMGRNYSMASRQVQWVPSVS